VNVWVKEDLLAQLDEFKKAGNYKSRSELVSLAVHRLVNTTN
jgi:metal-responsive CopG/Arc/MetJ family transcriptional regulator